MSLLSKLARGLYKAAGIANAVNIYASGNPERIIRHVVRKRMYKSFGRIGRYGKRR